MVWNPIIDLLLYYVPFCDDNMKKGRKYATLDLHLNYSKAKDSNEMHQLCNGPYKSKSDFLIIENDVVSIINYNGKMICRYHFWLWHFVSTSLEE